MSALLLSGIAAYYSVIGLATIFSGAFISVLIMGSVLELTKVVTVAWLTTNWAKASKTIRTYLCVSVLILMLITSMGAFGYLSKAHLQQTESVGVNSIQIDQLQSSIDIENRKIKGYNYSLDTLDKQGKISTQKRNFLAEQISTSYNKIESLSTKLATLKQSNAKATAEIGPLRYLAELIYGDSADAHFDESVRIIIMIIVIVFDPLAIVLLLAANISLGRMGDPVTNLWLISRSPKDKKSGFKSAIVSADTEEEANEYIKESIR